MEDVVEHGWLELNQGTRNLIQTNVSDLYFSTRVSECVLSEAINLVIIHYCVLNIDVYFSLRA